MPTDADTMAAEGLIDVSPLDTCGNGACQDTENCLTCSADCDCSCGDGVCTYGEFCRNCPQDCDCETLAATPPMGWNSWNRYHCDIDEDLARQTADAMVESGLKDAGYEFLNLDDCWQTDRDVHGEILADPDRFPSGIPALAGYVHGKGLKFGLYTCAGSKTCQGRPGSLGHEAQDAATYAAWEVDYIKVDWCHTYGLDAPTQYAIMHEALSAVDRPIVHSICNWGVQDPWVWGPEYGQLWRTTMDIGDTYVSMLINLELTSPLAAFASPGLWNDPDMLEVGNGGMTFEEYRSHMSLWSILAAPLILGNDVRDMTAETLALLTNEEVIAVDQDPAGLQGVRIQTEPYMIWTRPITLHGSRAVVLFNHTNDAQQMDVSWTQIGLAPGHAVVRDLWAREDLGPFEDAYSTPGTVAAHDSVMLIITGRERLPPAGESWVSDLPFKHQANAVGPVERDQSNGNEEASDGQSLTIDGATFDKGLGVHGSSIVLLHLGGSCLNSTACA